MVDLAAAESLIAARRTNLAVDPDRPVDAELVERLCALATWAPAHKRTWPWRFAAFTGESRSLLGNTMADALDPSTFDRPERIQKLRGKFLRAPVVVAVGSVPGGSELRTAENRDATSAAIQNLLLGATAAGLASYWSSGLVQSDAAVADLCGWEPGTAVIGIIYLGWPLSPAVTPERPGPNVRWFA